MSEKRAVFAAFALDALHMQTLCKRAMATDVMRMNSHFLSGFTDPARVADLFVPLEARLIQKYPVSSQVNKNLVAGDQSEYDGPECAEEVAAAPERSALS